MTWTDDRVETLKKLWHDGKSASVCAKELGGVTRNAVISKVHRLKLPTRDTNVKWSSKRARYCGAKGSAKVKAAVVRAKKAKQHLPPNLRPDPTPIPANVWQPLPGTTPVALLDLEPHHCRWPVSDDGKSCGCKKVPGVAYCATHARIATRPPTMTRTMTDNDSRRFNRGTAPAISMFVGRDAERHQAVDDFVEA